MKVNTHTQEKEKEKEKKNLLRNCDNKKKGVHRPSVGRLRAGR
jgi:hypothetical protein